MSDSDYEINPGASNPLMDLYRGMGSAAMQQRGPWMRPYLGPELSDFLGKGIPQALMGFGARMAPAAEVVPIPSSTLRGQVGMRGTARNPYPDKLNQYLDWEAGVEGPRGKGRFTEQGQAESQMEPANDRNLSDSRPGHKPPSDVLEQMAKEIKAQSQAEFAKFADPVGGRFDQAMRYGGKPPTVELNMPADKAFIQSYLDALQSKSNVIPFKPKD